MAVKPFPLINKSEHESIVEQVRQALDKWQDEWCAAPVPAIVKIMDAGSANTLDAIWKLYRAAAQIGVAVVLQSDWTLGAKSLITGTRAAAEANGELGSLTVNQFLRSLAMALLHKPGTVAGKEPPVIELGADDDHVASVADGVRVRCEIGADNAFELYLWAGLVESWIANIDRPDTRSATLTRAAEAIHGRSVSLEAVLGEAELTLDELQTLGIGDVIRLDRKLEEPLTIRLSDAAICAGYLGTAGDRKAVQLTAVDESLNRG